MKGKAEEPSRAVPRESGKRRLVRNALHSSGAWVVTAVVAMLATPYMLYSLGAEGYGVYVLLTSLVGYYGLFDLALGQGVVKFVAQYTAQGDQKGIAQSVNAALSIQIAAGFLGSCLLALAAGPVLWFLKVPADLMDSARTSLYLCAAGFFFTMLGSTFNSVLMGLQRYDITSKVIATANFLMMLVTVIVLAAGGGLTGAVAVAVVAPLGSCVVSYSLVRKLLSQWRFSPVFRGEYVRSVYRFSSFLFISRVSDLVNNYAGRFLIGYLLGPTAVAIYTVPTKLLNAFWGILGSSFGVLYPYASEIAGAQDPDFKRNVFLKSSRFFAAFALPVLLLVFAFAHPILRVWMGAGFANQAWLVLALLSVSAVLASTTTIPIQLALGWGHSKIVALFSLGTIVTYLAGMLVLSPLWGVTGAAAATIIATIPGVSMVVFLLRRVVRIRLMAYLREVYLIHLVGVILACAAWLGRDWLAQLPLVGSLSLALASAGIYGGVLVLAGGLDVRQVWRHIVPARSERNHNPFSQGG